MKYTSPCINPLDPHLEAIDGDFYELAAPYPVLFGSWLEGLQFVIPKGYRTDMASIPRWFRSFLDRASVGTLGPLVHDYLCDNQGCITTTSDQKFQIHWFEASLLFLLLMRIDGIAWKRALWCFLAVVVGGPRW